MSERVVCVVQRRLTHYRVPLFRSLERELADRGLRLVLLHGQPTESESTKNDGGEFPGAHRFTNWYVPFGGRTFCWQPVSKCLSKASLLVITQESAIISNYYLQLAHGRRNRKVAFWGHGRNFQSTAPHGVLEGWKRAWSRRVDWWFAYTQLSVDHLLKVGYPAERITCLENAVDTQDFRKAIERIAPREIAELRSRHGIPHEAVVGLYCGSLYPEKRLEFLVDAADLVRRRMPAFHLVMVGDGPQRGWLQRMAIDRPWMHVLGALYGNAKAAWYASSSVIVNPGAVGLGILDAFAAGLPMVTMRSALHGPEIAYLKDGDNGRMVSGESSDEYAEAVLEMLIDDSGRTRIGQQAASDARLYTIDRMAERFADGIERALAGVTRTAESRLEV